MTNYFKTIKNDLYKVDELSAGLEFYRWIPNFLSNKRVIIFNKLQKCKIIEICQKLEDESIKTNIKYSFDKDGVIEVRETQVFGLLEYAYGGPANLPSHVIRNNTKDFIATGLFGSLQLYFFKVGSYNINTILELTGGRKTKNKK